MDVFQAQNVVFGGFSCTSGQALGLVIRTADDMVHTTYNDISIYSILILEDFTKSDTKSIDKIRSKNDQIWLILAKSIQNESKFDQIYPKSAKIQMNLSKNDQN
jgi:hypothetical protein